MRQLLTILTLVVTLSAQGGNRVLSPEIRTLKALVGGDWQNRPVMELRGGEVLTVGFDQMSHEAHRYTCHISRHEADWSEAEEVFESEWLVGFNDFPIDDYEPSLNTTVSYLHYTMRLPNSQCRLKMSGNYRLTIYDEDEGHEAVAEVELMVVEPLMNVQLSASSNTDIDVHSSHQQVSLGVTYNGLRVTSPDTELYTVVMQNWNEQDRRVNVRPNYQHQQGLRWEHQQDYIFKAGNEYHKFEILDTSHPTMGIERIGWDGERYQAYPFPATVSRNYLTDETAKGGCLIRNSDNTEVDYTCDYVCVNFTLQSPWLGEVFIDGLWTDRADRSAYRMQYDGEQECYYTQLLLKQGYYSYRFATTEGQAAPQEGSYYQTSNTYQALVYYRSPSDRSWRLVGVALR